MQFGTGNGRTQGDEHHVAATAREVAEHASALSRLELELAGLELKQKATKLAVGSTLAVVSAVLGLFGLGFALAALAAGIATATPWWVALLIVTAGVMVVAATLALVAKGRFKSATPPIPDQAIREAKLTRDAISS